MTDSAGRTTALGWCGCNSITQLTDANGNTTSWNRDTQGRVTNKTLPDGRATQYSYDRMTGRLALITDAKGQNHRLCVLDNLEDLGGHSVGAQGGGGFLGRASLSASAREQAVEVTLGRSGAVPSTSRTAIP